MSKLKNKIIIMFFILMILFNVKVKAASFTATVTKTTLEIGETVSVTIKADNAAGMYKVTSSDTSVLEISKGNASEFLDNTSATITFKAKKSGTAVIKAIPTDMTDNDDSSKNISDSKSFTITVKDTNTDNKKNTDKTDTKSTTTTTKSNNANLSTLGVTPKQYDFSGFKSNITEYTLPKAIPNNVDSLKVAYKTSDKNAKVKVSGNSNLEVGSNKIEVTVTAEDGKTTKTYTINVTKLAEEDEKPGNVIENEEEIYLTSLSLEGVKISPEFKKDVYSYTATIKESEESSVEVNAVANSEKANVEISGNTNITVGENIINVVLTLEGSYEQKVYQITLNVEEQEKTTVDEQENLQDSGIVNNLLGNIKKYVIIVISVIVFIVVLLILLLCLIKKDKDEDEEDKDLNNVKEYNIYENDTNEFKNDSNIEKSKKREKGKHSK